MAMSMSDLTTPIVLNSENTILLIDDDPDIVWTTTRMLEEAGYTVLSGFTAAEALSLTQRHRPSILLLDVELPDGNGVDVARQIKLDPELAGVFVVLLSGARISPQDQADGLRNGLADGYVIRPFSKVDFLARIEAFFRIRLAQEELKKAKNAAEDASYLKSELLIKLEIQNEELCQARNAVEAALEKYTDLFDFAPVGYLTLNREGVINAVNLTSVSLLGIKRAMLLGRRFGLLVVDEARPLFADFLGKVFASQGKESCEVTLSREGNSSLIVQIEAMATASGQECRLAMIDIAGRRQAEDALRESEERLYRLTEMAADAIIMLDDKGTVTFSNAAAEKMFGWSAAEITGRNFHRVFIPERLYATARQAFTRFSEQGTGPLLGRTTEVVALRRDGIEFPLELSVSSMNIKGKLHAIGIMRDITERKRVEEELRDSKEHYRAIIETFDGQIYICSQDYLILFMNEKLIERNGRNAIGEPCFKALHGLEAICPWCVNKRVFKGETVRWEIQSPKDGRWYYVVNAPIYNEDGSISKQAMIQDVTERKLVEGRISEVMHQQQAILDNIPNIAWLKDREGRYVAVNEPFSREFGLAPKELVGKNDHDIYPPKRAVRHEKDSQGVMATGTRTYFEESTVDRKGKVQYVEKVETPIFSDTGVVIGVIGIAHDITSRKEVEVSLRHDSTHDDLTGLYNRAFFDEELKRLAHGRMFPMSIVMGDVNGLKTVNDTLGHAAGDNMIRMAARIILEAFRGEDVVARIGGDEFAVLLPETAATVAEEAVGRILGCPEIINCQVSIAFGIASAENKDQLAEALKHSDERMYRHKSDQKKL